MKKKLYIAVRTTQDNCHRIDGCFETMSANENKDEAIECAKNLWQDHQFEIVEIEITPNEDKYL